MRRVRVIPVLTLDGTKLVKTVKFKKPNYIGDPVNAIKIFNDKEVDEIVVLDITASKQGKAPNFRLIEEMAGECFMPLAYGGGIRSLDDASRLFSLGVEKIIVNTAMNAAPKVISQISEGYGAQAMVVSIDVRKKMFGGNKVHFVSGQKAGNDDPVTAAIKAEALGAGELFLNHIDRDGTFQGYDLDLLKTITQAVNVPVVACGGARSIEDFHAAIGKSGASAVAAGSMFVYRGNDTRSILINYPAQRDLMEGLYTQI